MDAMPLVLSGLVCLFLWPLWCFSALWPCFSASVVTLVAPPCIRGPQSEGNSSIIWSLAGSPRQRQRQAARTQGKQDKIGLCRGNGSQAEGVY